MSLESANRTPLQRLHQWFVVDIWSDSASKRRGPLGWALSFVRIAVLVVRGFRQHHWPFHAAALTYVTVLSLAPFLAFVFSVAKGFGAYDTLREGTIEPFLDSTFPTLEPERGSELARGPAGASDLVLELHPTLEIGPAVNEAEVPAGAAPTTAPTPDEPPRVAEPGHQPAQPADPSSVNLRELAETVLDYVQSTDFAALGLFGLITLVYTVVRMLGGVERSLNEIWEVESQRSATRKLIDYVAMVVVVPIVAVTITGLGTALREGSSNVAGGDAAAATRWGAAAVGALSGWTPYLAVVAAFGFLYYAMPNTRTRVGSSLVGAMVGGGAWRGLVAAYGTFNLGETNINPIYVGFAALPLVMLWIYFSWMAVVMGAEVAAAYQLEPTLRGSGRIDRTDQAWVERVGVRAAVRVTATFLAGRRAEDLPRLAGRLGVAERSLGRVLRSLERGRVLVRESGRRHPAYLPARKPETIRLNDALRALRGDDDPANFPPQSKTDAVADRALDAVYGAALEGSANPSLAELAERELRLERPELEPEPDPEDEVEAEFERDLDLELEAKREPETEPEA